MTKKKHPQNRWDRLQAKKRFDEKKKGQGAGKARRRLVNKIKAQETEDELRAEDYRDVNF